MHDSSDGCRSFTSWDSWMERCVMPLDAEAQVPEEVPPSGGTRWSESDRYNQ